MQGAGPQGFACHGALANRRGNVCGCSFANTDANGGVIAQVPATLAGLFASGNGSPSRGRFVYRRRGAVQFSSAARRRANSTNQSTHPAFAIASALSTCFASAPISSFFNGSSIFLPDKVRGTAAT